MSDVNKVILVGRTGNAPEVKYSQSGTAFASVSLATTAKWKDGNGNWQEKTEWHRLKVVGKKAETFGNYVEKGQLLYIDGRIEYGSYEKDGVKFYTTDIFVTDFQMLGGRNEQRGGGGERREREAPRREQAPVPSAADDFVDDSGIPF